MVLNYSGIFEECEQRGQLIEKLRQENDKLRKNSEAERQRRLQSDTTLLSPLPHFENPLADNLTLEMEREREDYIQKSNNLKERLENLRSNIEVLKVEDSSLLGEEVDEIQSGTTMARVAFFEEL